MQLGIGAWLWYPTPRSYHTRLWILRVVPDAVRSLQEHEAGGGTTKKEAPPCPFP